MDAIHLSTARRLDAKEFFTYEPRLVKFGELTGLAVSEPYTTQPPRDAKGLQPTVTGRYPTRSALAPE